MKKIYIFTAVMSLAVSFAFALTIPASVFAQSYYGITPVQYNTYGNTYAPYNGVCTNLTAGLYKGLRDTTTGGQVSALQSFLIAQKYLVIAAPTGYFGALTYQAITRYQYDHELPSNGTADLATRASIQTVSCGNNYGYNNGYNNYYGAPVLTSFSPSSGAVGTSVTIYGSGFDYSNNTVNFNGVTMTSIPSYNGTSLTFTVPQVNTYGNTYNYSNTYNNNNQYCVYPYTNCNNNTIGTYPVSVATTRGTSNSLQFTVTSGNSNNTNCYNSSYNGYTNGVYNNCYSGPVSVSNVSGPTTLATGAQGIWSLTLYNPNSSYVTVNARWGDEGSYNYYTSASQQSVQSSSVQGQQTVTFTHTYGTSGYYNVVFTATDNQGGNTSVSATVNVSSGSVYQTQPYLSSISPSSGRVGTQVVLYGSGFTSYGNTVHFGSGGAMNISSTSGTTLLYTIPYTVSGCDITSGYGTMCPMYAQQITPGTYPVYVSNSNGQTSTIYFTVTY